AWSCPRRLGRSVRGLRPAARRGRCRAAREISRRTWSATERECRSWLQAPQPGDDLVDLGLMEGVDDALQLALRRRGEVLAVDLLQRAGQVNLRLHAPRRPPEELGLHGQLLRADVERVEAAHGRI